MNSYAMADWLEYLTREEVNALKELVLLLPDNPVVVNIGAGSGTSALAFLEARTDLSLYTIDIQEESSPLGCLEGERNAVMASGVDYQGRWFQICGDSKEVGYEWQEGEVDMVFIDGDHSYEGCSGDIKAWKPHIRYKGIMALHDYQKPADNKPHPGVDQAVDELLLFYHAPILRVDTLVAFRM